MYGQGFRGFKSQIKEDEADDEKARARVISKMFFNSIEAEHGEQIKQIIDEQQQID